MSEKDEHLNIIENGGLGENRGCGGPIRYGGYTEGKFMEVIEKRTIHMIYSNS